MEVVDITEWRSCRKLPYTCSKVELAPHEVEWFFVNKIGIIEKYLGPDAEPDKYIYDLFNGMTEKAFVWKETGTWEDMAKTVKKHLADFTLVLRYSIACYYGGGDDTFTQHMYVPRTVVIRRNMIKNAASDLYKK